MGCCEVMMTSCEMCWPAKRRKKIVISEPQCRWAWHFPLLALSFLTISFIKTKWKISFQCSLMSPFDNVGYPLQGFSLCLSLSLRGSRVWWHTGVVTSTTCVWQDSLSLAVTLACMIVGTYTAYLCRDQLGSVIEWADTHGHTDKNELGEEDHSRSEGGKKRKLDRMYLIAVLTSWSLFVLFQSFSPSSCLA